MPDLSSVIQQITIWALPVLLAITLHEVAHGYAARHFGDPTAARAGRLSLNPLRHVDLVGTIIVPIVLLLLPGSFLFGWAKPVPVDPRNFARPRQHMGWVAIAGPASNLLMAVGWTLLLKLTQLADPQLSSINSVYLAQVSMAGIMVNLVLMALNMLPLPPLDGGRVMVGVLPSRQAWLLSRVEPFGMIILIGLMFLHVLGPVLAVPVTLGLELLLSLFAIDLRAIPR